MSENKIQLPAWFADKMILQQRVRLRIYGSTMPLGRINVTLERFPAENRLSAGDTEYGVIFQESDQAEGDGFFEFKLPLIEGSYDTFKLTIESEGGRRSFNEIRFGEVWLAAGESNLTMPVYLSDVAPLLDSCHEGDGLRFFSQNENGLPVGTEHYSPEPVAKIYGAHWFGVDDKKRMANMSATALSFALALQRELKLPIAIYLLAASESMIHSWLPRGVVEQDAIIKNHVREIMHYRDKEHWNELPQEERKEERTLRKQQVEAKDLIPRYPLFKRMNQPGALFNHKLSPYTGLALRGIIWAQGESDCQYPEYYRRAFHSLSVVWEQMFQSPITGLALVYPQLSPNYVSSIDAARLAYFNEALASVRKKLKLKAGLVTLYDLPLDYPQDDSIWGRALNPKAKRVVGERLAQIALGLAYHRDTASSAPECASAELVGNKLVLSFSNAAKGIRLRSGEIMLKGFSISAAEGRSVLALAKELYGVRTIVWHPEISVPRSCSYAFSTFNQEANLCGVDGIPVVPFRLEREQIMGEKPREWMYCDKIESWRVPADDLIGPKKSGLRQAAYHQLWQITAGSGSFKLEKDNKRHSHSALLLEYRKADEKPIVFGPDLSFASDYTPLDLAHWTEIVLHVFNADHRKKSLALCLADANGRETISEKLEVNDLLAWQSLRFVLKNAPVDLMRLVSLEFMLLDPGERGSLFIDEVSFQGLQS